MNFRSWYSWGSQREFEVLKGLTLTSIERVGGNEGLIFRTTDGREFHMLHQQDCCEGVTLEDVTGNFDDLIGNPITMAEVVTYGGGDDGNWESPKRVGEWPEDVPELEYTPESYTWTFYKLATVKGYVTLRWFGESNGYYSESVDFYELTENDSDILA